MKNVLLVCLLALTAQLMADSRGCGCGAPKPRPRPNVAPAQAPKPVVPAPVAAPEEKPSQAPGEGAVKVVAAVRSEEEEILAAVEIVEEAVVRGVTNSAKPVEVAAAVDAESAQEAAPAAGIVEEVVEVAQAVAEAIEIFEAVEGELSKKGEAVPAGLIACKRALMEGEMVVAAKDMAEAMMSVMEEIAQEQMARAECDCR